MHDPNGPIPELEHIGLPRPPWAENEKATENQWEYTTGFLSSKGVRDLAFLILDGWQIDIHARSSMVRIRARRKDTQ